MAYREIDKKKEFEEFPEHFLDLKEYEINYLIYLKDKRERRMHWDVKHDFAFA